MQIYNNKKRSVKIDTKSIIKIKTYVSKDAPMNYDEVNYDPHNFDLTYNLHL